MTETDKSALLSAEAATDVQPRRFSHDEMVTCESCLRANPPTRASCLYCAAVLPATAAVRTSEVEEPEPIISSVGCYVVLFPNTTISEPSLEQLAARLQIKLAEVQAAVSARGHIPTLHLNSDQADRLVAELREIGLDALSIKAEELKSNLEGKKIRALEFSERGLTGLNITSGERVFELWDDVVLIVAGRLHTNHAEVVERRRRGGLKPLDRREFSGDESIFDLYSRSSPEGWRISAGNFDFSCLGDRKGITAFENFRTLIELLRERARNLQVDESYSGMRPLLATVWPPATNTRKGGWRRSGAGKYDMSTVTTTDNETQFNNYSRLLQCLKMRELSQKPDH